MFDLVAGIFIVFNTTVNPTTYTTYKNKISACIYADFLGASNSKIYVIRYDQNTGDPVFKKYHCGNSQQYQPPTPLAETTYPGAGED